MMNRDRGSNSVKNRKPRVKTGVSNTKLDVPTPPIPLTRSNTLPNYPISPRVPRGSSLGLPDKEKARSDDGFHSDSDKDSNQSANSNISSKSYLVKPPSIKSNVVAKVRPKSSLGTMSDNSLSDKSKVELDIVVLKADMQAEEARKNRKIEDLEISIQSLARFNAELEATNKKQAAEIEKLKRRLRIDNSLSSICESEVEVSTPLSEIDLAEIEKDNDARFRRICTVIDDLTQDAKKALAYTSKIGGSKVLTNAQLDSPTLKAPTESESDLAEESNIDIISHKTKSNSSVVNEQTFVKGPKIKPTTEKDNTNSTTIQPHNLSFTELSDEKNQRLQANVERARAVTNELLSLEKQDNNKGHKGLGLLLSVQNGHSPHITHSSINGSDSPQPSPRMVLLYELQESLGICDTESSKYLKENRRSLPTMSSSRIHSDVISPSEESEEGGDSRPSMQSQTQSNKPRRRSFKTQSFPPMSNMSRGIKDNTVSSLVKKDDSVLNSLSHGSDVEKRSQWFPIGILTFGK